jgi:hypothetical protein
MRRRNHQLPPAQRHAAAHQCQRTGGVLGVGKRHKAVAFAAAVVAAHDARLHDLAAERE